jgi:uncharacterized protein YciI
LKAKKKEDKKGLRGRPAHLDFLKGLNKQSKKGSGMQA